MAAIALTSKTVMRCPHGGTVKIVLSRPQSATAPLGPISIGDTFLIAGCPHMILNGIPSPCISVKWLSFSSTKVNGQPGLDQKSTGVCLSGAQNPQGSVIVQA